MADAVSPSRCHSLGGGNPASEFACYPLDSRLRENDVFSGFKTCKNKVFYADSPCK